MKILLSVISTSSAPSISLNLPLRLLLQLRHRDVLLAVGVQVLVEGVVVVARGPRHRGHHEVATAVISFFAAAAPLRFSEGTVACAGAAPNWVVAGTALILRGVAAVVDCSSLAKSEMSPAVLATSCK